MNEQEIKTLPLRFSGNGDEYFKIWIVNSILTVLTLGIYSAWAKVRTNRYFYGNTFLENSAFEYHATPMTILKGRLIAIAALIVYVFISKLFPISGFIFLGILTIITPWIIWRSIQFNARMVSYRNVRFNFRGELKEIYNRLLIPVSPIIFIAILGIIVLFILGKEIVASYEMVVTGFFFTILLAIALMYPYMKMLLASYYINNRQYGQGKFLAELSANQYYMIYFRLIAKIFLILFIGIVMISIMLLAGIDLHILMITIILPLYIFFIMLSVWTTAYLEANFKNYLLNNTKLDDVLEVTSNIQVNELFGIYFTNSLLLMFTFGLAYPWTIIRLKKYKIESTSVVIKGDISQYVNQQQQTQSALGEEMGDAFDAELDLGI